MSELPFWYDRDRVMAFQRRRGLVPDGLAGPKTWDAIAALEARAATQPEIPRWLVLARSHIGVTERPGDEHEPLILHWLTTTSLGRWGRGRDETPWCSAFVNAMLERAGLEGTKSAMARSWLGWGVPCEPRIGAVVVLPRGQPPAGHVGFVSSLRAGAMEVLGGNQGNRVSVVSRRVGDAIGFRWPAEGT